MIDNSTPASGGTRAFSRKTPLFWPFMLSVILTALATIGLLVHEPMLLVLAFLVVLPVTAIAWPIALHRRGVFLELSVTGIRAAGREIPWRNLANYRVLREAPDNHQTLTLELNEPLPALGWTQRLNSFLSRGTSDRVLSISLRYAQEKPEIIDAAIHNYWRDMLGDDITFAAAGKQIAKYQRELRKFSALPANEKWRSIIAVSAIFLLLGWCWHGVQVPFWSSPGWSRMSWWVAACMTALGLFALLRRRGLASLRNQQSTLAYLVMSLFVFALLSTCTWLIIGRSLPDLATRVLGTSQQSTATLHKIHKAGSSEHCMPGMITGEQFVERFPAAYCARGEEYERLPDAGPMRLVTRESWFGVHIERIEPIDPEFQR